MKHVLIIGGTSAIASACARLWATEGARLFVVARDGGRLEQTAADLRARGAESVSVHRLDLTDTEGQLQMLEAAKAALGRIDVVLVAHGTLPDQNACERDTAVAAAAFAVNALSVVTVLIGAAGVLEAQRQGCLAVISSVAGDRGRRSNYVYGSAKAAVSTLCEGLWVRMARVGVHVLDIRPGFVDTPMTSSLQLPGLLLTQPDAVARRILAGIERRKRVLYVPRYWQLIMMVVRSIPAGIYRRLPL